MCLSWFAFNSCVLKKMKFCQDFLLFCPIECGVINQDKM